MFHDEYRQWQEEMVTESSSGNSAINISITSAPSLENMSLTNISLDSALLDNSTMSASPTSTILSLPADMSFNDDSLMSVVIYSILFFIAGFGNLTVFITLFRNRHRRSRVNLFIMHLAIADLIVTFFMMPLEIGWHVTVSWNAGDVACRVCMFFRAFGFYLSSFILIVISLDRYFAIAHPLSLSDADKRGRLMLTLSWLFSTLASLPQSVIFHVETHPTHLWFSQCVTFHFFPNYHHELAYNLFNVVAVYLAPLSVIVVSYTLILWEITKKTKEGREQLSTTSAKALRRRERPNGDFRRSGIGRIEKARTRTLRMTIVIVLVFIVCWTPYFVMSAWWWFDQDSASKIHSKLQKGLFLFAVSNSCMDPIVYGVFAVNFLGEFRRCCFHSRPHLLGTSSVCQRTAQRPGTAPASRHSNTTGSSSRKTANDTCTAAPSIDQAYISAHTLSSCEHCVSGDGTESTPSDCGSSHTAHTPLQVANCRLARVQTPPYIALGHGGVRSHSTYTIT